MSNLGKAYSRLNKSLQNRFCTAWTHLPKMSSANPNCIKQDDVDRVSASFSGVFKRPSNLDLVKDARSVHVGVQTASPYLEVFDCNITFKQGDYVQDSNSVKYEIRSVEHMERGSVKMTLAYGVAG